MNSTNKRAEEQAKLTLDAWRKSLYGAPIASLWDQFNKPIPHYVRYRNGDVRYTPPELVYISHREYVPSPSDCTWIVPGTLERKI